MITPLSLSIFCANGYIAYWYYQMANQGTPYEGPPPIDVIQRGMIYTAGIGLWLTVLIWWFIKRKQYTFSSLFSTSAESFGKDVMWGALLGVSWVLVYGLLGWPSFSDMFVLDKAKLISIPTSLSAGFCEEFLFRGFLIMVIAQAGGKKKAQIIWSSLAFGLAHFHWGPIGALFTVALGASFAVVTIRRGNVWAAVVAHTILNLCIEPGLLHKVMAMYSQ